MFQSNANNQEAGSFHQLTTIIQQNYFYVYYIYWGEFQSIISLLFDVHKKHCKVV